MIERRRHNRKAKALQLKFDALGIIISAIVVGAFFGFTAAVLTR